MLVSAARSAGPLTIAAVLGALERVAPSALEALLDEAVTSPEPVVAERAVSVAASLGGDAATRRLVAALAHPVWHVRAAAARWLGTRATGADIAALRDQWVVETDPSVRAVIEDALEPLEG